MTDSLRKPTHPRPEIGATAWRRPALAMFAVGYGANQFVPLLEVYRHTLDLSDAQATAIFGVYALGLIPGLLLAGPASDRYGRRPLMLAFAGLSLVATAVLITGRWGSPGLYAGRLVTGVVSGAVFSVGTAWVKELSEDAPSGTGARRAALALTAGFAVGPAHRRTSRAVGARPAGPALPAAPDTRRPHAHPAAAGTRDGPRAPTRLPPHPRAIREIPQIHPRRRAPGPLGVRQRHAGVHDPAGARRGARRRPDRRVLRGLAALALGAGIAVQPLGRRLHDAAVRRGTADAAATGLALVTAGCLAAAAATAHPGPAAATGAALLLGAGYGLCILSGLREVEHLAPPGELGSLVGIFYSLAYAGLAIPYLLSLAASHLGYPTALLLAALAAALTLLLLVVQGRRHPTGPTPLSPAGAVVSHCLR
ncbi:MAG: MFS transporter [Geodermatophilaceae bacterium]